MANVFDQFDSKAQGGNVFDQFDEAPKVVTAGQAGKRGLAQGFGAVNQWAGNMAMLPFIGAEIIANQFRDKPDFGMSDWAMGKFVQPFESMQQKNAIKQGEELSPLGVAANVAGNLVGQAPALSMPMAPANQALRMAPQALPVAEQVMRIIGREFVQAQPLAQSAMVQRSNQLQAEGVPVDVANNAALAGYGVDALGYAVPISATGNVLKRMATGAPANIAASLPAVARENFTLEASGYGDHVTDPFSTQNLTTEGVTGAVLAALLGQRAPRYQTAEMVQQGRALDAAKDQAILDSSIVPDSGLSVADIIGQATGAGAVPPTKEAISARRKDSALAFGKQPEDPIIYRRESMDPVTGEMLPSTEAGSGNIATDANRLAGQQQARAAETMGGRLVDPNVAASYGEAGIDPNSVASAFERARQFGTPDPNAEPDVRSLKAELGPDEVGLIEQYTGMTPEDIANLGPNAQRRVLAQAMQAKEADAGRGTMVTSYGEEPLSSPASKPDVPGDRMAMPGELDESGRRITGDAREAGVGADVDPAVAKQAAAKKAKMVEKLDAMRQQQDAMDESPVWRDLKRKQEMGLGMTDKERKAYAAMRDQREKLGRSIFDLEGKIYDIEARSEQGSRTSTGNSDRPFKMDDSSGLDFNTRNEDGTLSDKRAAKFERDARAKAAAEEQAAIDRMEAEWRERQRMRRQEQAQQQAGQRKRESDAEQHAQRKYAGKKGSTTEAPMEGGKFKADENGFVMSDTGSPLQFGHQRDAGWWILRRGNKGNTGQVFEIANHPSGKGYTVRVTMDNGGGDGGGRAGDGGGSFGRDMGGGDLIPRSGGDRGTGGKRWADNNNAGTGGRTIAAGPVADAGRQDVALTPEPAEPAAKPVEWVNEAAVREEVRRMAENTGLAEKGGHVVRTFDETTGREEVTGRTKAIPMEDWWLQRPSVDTVGKRGKEGRRFKHSEAETKQAVSDWLAGKPLKKKQQEIVDFMRDVAEQRLREQAEYRAMAEEDAAIARAEREAIQAADEFNEFDAPPMTDAEIEAMFRGMDDEAEAGFGQYSAREAAESNRGSEGNAEGPARDSAEAQPFVLELPAPDDIRAREQQRADAERADRVAADKAKVDAEPFVMTGSDRPADQAEARGQGTLYSNPFADPQLWARAAKDAGHAIKALNKAMADGLGWSLDHAGQFGQFMRDWAKEMSDFVASDRTKQKAMGAGLKDWVPGQKVIDPVWRMLRAFADNAGGDMMAVAKNSGSKTMVDLVKRFHGMTYDTSGEAKVSYAHKTEYEYGKMFSPVARALIEVEKLAKTAGRDVEKTMEQVYNLVQNPRNIRRGNAIHDAAHDIRTKLDEALKYMREAGVEVGDAGPGYFPRQINKVAAMNSPDAFKRALEEAYRREKNLSPEFAKTAADELYKTIVYGDGSLFSDPAGKPRADFMQGRVFSKAVEDPKHPLYPFLEHDPREVLPSYFRAAAHRAEYARIMGETPDKWKDMRDTMIKDGAHPEAIRKLESFIQNVAGMRGGVHGNNAIAAMRTAGYLMFLEKAMLTSIPEFIAPAIRTGNVLNVHRSLVTTIKSLVSKNSKDIRELTELMDTFGILSAHFGDLTTQNRWGGGDMESAKLSKLMDRHSRMTFLTQWTEATRYGAFAINRTFVRQLARGVKDKAGKLNTELLAEIGVPKDKIAPFSKWLLDTNNGMPTKADIDKAPKEMVKLYEQAMQLLDKSEILRPTATTRPGWTNDHPVLALFTQLMSYNYAFLAEVWKRNAVMAYRGAKDIGKATGSKLGMDMKAEYEMAERMQMLKPLLMMPLLVVAQGLVGEARDLLDPSMSNELTDEQKAFRALSRGIPFAPVDPLLNVVTGAKFQRSATETIAGPTLGIYGRGIDAVNEYFVKNSEHTNTNERALARNFYDSILEPSLAAMLAMGYAVAPTPASKGLFMATRQTLGAGATKELFVRNTAPTFQEMSGDTDIDYSGKKKPKASDEIAF